MIEHHFATPIYWYTPNPIECKMILNEFKSRQQDIDSNLKILDQDEYDLPRKTDQYHQEIATETYNMPMCYDYVKKHVEIFKDSINHDQHIECERMWINRIDRGDIHIWHSHARATIVGTLYLQVEQGDIEFKTPNPFTRSMLVPTRGEYSPVIGRTPKAGDIGIWPGWLEHRVTTNNSETSRYAMSFEFS